MRNRLTLLTVVGLLLCSLSTIELPELVNLIDNTSNDYSLVVFGKDAPTVTKVRVGTLHRGGRAADISRLPTAAPFWIATSIQPLHMPEDILHLFCVQRT